MEVKETVVEIYCMKEKSIFSKKKVKVPQMLKIDLAYNPALPFLGIDLTNSVSYSRAIWLFLFINLLFTISRQWK